MAKDVIQATIDILKADPGVAGLCEDRVFGGELPGDQAESMPKQAVVVRRISGGAGAGGFTDVERGTLETLCWGESFLEADEVRQAVHAALKQARRQEKQDFLIHGYNPLTSPVTDRDAETQWPFSLMAWEFMASEIEVA